MGDEDYPAYRRERTRALGIPGAAKPFRFNGPTYDPAFDRARLSGQILRIFTLMRDGRWRTLPEIEGATGAPPASASSQLRHLRKPRFGEHIVLKRRRGDPALGLYEYRLEVNHAAPD